MAAHCLLAETKRLLETRLVLLEDEEEEGSRHHIQPSHLSSLMLYCTLVRNVTHFVRLTTNSIANTHVTGGIRCRSILIDSSFQFERLTRQIIAPVKRPHIFLLPFLLPLDGGGGSGGSQDFDSFLPILSLFFAKKV